MLDFSVNILKKLLNIFKKAGNDDLTQSQPGLSPVKENQESGLKGDIIFVHGLGGHKWNTWDWQKPKDPKRKKEYSWLFRLAQEDDLKGLSIWTFGYDAAKFFLEGRSASRFEQARLLISSLEGRGLGQKPLFFITHSLGGLVVKDTLRIAQTNELAIFGQTKGIVFLATPHLGADLVKMGQLLSTISFKLLGLSISAEELERSSSDLRDLDEWYRKNAVKSDIRTLPFYEMYDTWGIKVVDEDSGNPKVPNQEFCSPVPTDHIGIAKVKPKDALVYPRVKKFILKTLNQDKKKSNNSEGAEQELLNNLIEQVRSRCCNKIQNLYSKIQLLNLQQIDVERLYVDVYVLETPSYISPATIPDLLKVSGIGENFDRYLLDPYLLEVSIRRENFDRLGLGQRGKRSRGLEAAKKYPRLMILGKPGSGKSTFLKHIAVACCKGDFLAGYIPILIELRNIDANNFNLLNVIHQEFELDNEEQTEKQIKQILNQAKVLILLDGLDEVPRQFRQKVQKDIEKFSKQYYKNRFILTCRTQTTEYRLSNFEYIEVADFNSEQVKCFANNWFSTINETPEQKTKLTKEFIEKLRAPENKQIAELAITPILLSLTCWIFTEPESFPSKRSDLYKRGMKLLLEKWDKTKGIQRYSDSEIYRKMSVLDRQKLLSYIAFCKFQKQQYALFEQNEIQEYIAQFIQKTISNKVSIEEDIEQIPKTIEQQHGLIVERADEIYSFSHLTFQEFLTAQHISNESRLVKQLAENHITDTRWREIFLLLAELIIADDLLLAMEQQIPTYINTPKLQSLLTWAEQIIDTSPTDIKPVGKRAIACSFAIWYARAGARAADAARAGAIATAYAADAAYTDAAIAYASRAADAAIADATSRADAAIADASRAADAAIADAARADAARAAAARAAAAKAAADYVRQIKNLKVYKNINFNDLLDKLEKLKEESPDKNQTPKIYPDFVNKIIQTMLEGFHLTTEMIDFSEEEFRSLETFFNANKLMIECKEAAVRVSQKTWNGIEERMLLPTERGS